jgi:hypothetical protein
LIEVSQVTKSKQLIDQGSAKGHLSLRPVENLFAFSRIFFAKRNIVRNWRFSNTITKQMQKLIGHGW